MSTRSLRVWRGDAAGGDLTAYEVDVQEGEVVLDVIHRVQATQAPDLAVRWNCKAGKCGSCSAEVNGKPRLMCMTEKTDRLLFIDTDINITKSYSKYLFNKPLNVADWIEVANKADLYLFLEPDCEFVQDGTRLPDEERKKLSLFHKEQLKETGIAYFSIHGNWNERLEKAIAITKKYFNL